MRDFRQAFRMMREVYKVANILVCDDDKDIVEAISIYLEQEGYVVFKAYDGLEAINILRSQPVDLLIIDIMMPKLDGIRATLKIREENPLPIIILSAKSEDADKILGLNVGADDYVTKPFNPLELVARVKSQLRRYTRLGAAIPVENAHIYETGGLSINDDLKEVRVDGDVVKLTPIEYNILFLLMKNQGRLPDAFYSLLTLKSLYPYQQMFHMISVQCMRRSLMQTIRSLEVLMTQTMNCLL